MENVWPQRLVFATLMAAMWTEGSYLYMLLCILISAESDDRDYWYVQLTSFVFSKPEHGWAGLC